MREIVSLGREKAIAAIQDYDIVMWKSGVWNQYKKGETDYVIARIKSCGYGADVYEDEEGMRYVSMPCDSDMW